MAADDLSDFSAEWVEPISTTYHDWKVYELPPNGHGITALEMLNIMAHLPSASASPDGSAELHGASKR
jgi:gamma-glutamyltranspeptidase / glutathione hydrolase